MTPPLSELAKLSSAEEFFLAFGLPFDQHVLDVHRLHILHRFRAYLAKGNHLGEADAETWRDCLLRAYADYAGSATPPKTFKVFQKPGFVPLSSLVRK